MTNDLNARIGCNLRALRVRAGFDIDAMACRTGLQPAVIGLYEAGRQRLPVDVLAQLARLLDRPVGDFFA